MVELYTSMATLMVLSSPRVCGDLHFVQDGNSVLLSVSGYSQDR